MQHPLLLVFGLEDTLFHLSDTPLARRADFCLGDRHGYIRPGAIDFINSVLADPGFAVAVWSGLSQSEADRALEAIGISLPSLLTVFGHEKFVGRLAPGRSGEKEYVMRPTKALPIMSVHAGWPMGRMLFIDAANSYHTRQNDSRLCVDSYFARETQPHLFPAMLEMLSQLRLCSDVRKIGKFGWYEAITEQSLFSVQKAPAKTTSDSSFSLH